MNDRVGCNHSYYITVMNDRIGCNHSYYMSIMNDRIGSNHSYYIIVMNDRTGCDIPVGFLDQSASEMEGPCFHNVYMYFLSIQFFIF